MEQKKKQKNNSNNKWVQVFYSHDMNLEINNLSLAASTFHCNCLSAAGNATIRRMISLVQQQSISFMTLASHVHSTFGIWYQRFTDSCNKTDVKAVSQSDFTLISFQTQFANKKLTRIDNNMLAYLHKFVLMKPLDRLLK